MKRLVMVMALMFLFMSCEILVIDATNDYRHSVLGDYYMEEFSQTYNQYYRYDVFIRQSYGTGQVVIDNFYNERLSIRAEVRGTQLYIQTQTVNGYRVEGSGNIYDHEIRMTYRVTDTHTARRTDFCEATLVKSW